MSSGLTDLAQLQTKVDKLIADLTNETVASITGYSFILDALFVANIFRFGIRPPCILQKAFSTWG